MVYTEKPNIRNKWYQPINDLPNTQRTVLVKCKNLPEVCFGVYHKKSGMWGVFVDGGEQFDCDVMYWRDIPTPPLEMPYPYHFRSAAEVRYLSELAKSDTFDMDTAKKFYEIRTTLIYSTITGSEECKINSNLLTAELMKNLKSAGYTVYIDDEDENITHICWGY